MSSVNFWRLFQRSPNCGSGNLLLSVIARVIPQTAGLTRGNPGVKIDCFANARNDKKEVCHNFSVKRGWDREVPPIPQVVGQVEGLKYNTFSVICKLQNILCVSVVIIVYILFIILLITFKSVPKNFCSSNSRLNGILLLIFLISFNFCQLIG